MQDISVYLSASEEIEALNRKDEESGGSYADELQSLRCSFDFAGLAELLKSLDAPKPVDQPGRDEHHEETRTVSVYLNDNRAYYSHCRSMAKQAKKIEPDAPRCELAENIETFTRDLLCVDDLSPFASDLINGALDRVNFLGIAERFLED